MNEKVRAQIRALAALMKAKKEAGQKFVVMLGAGASYSSDVPPTPKIMEELLDKYGEDIEGRDPKERFDKLWKRWKPEDRATFLEPYLDKTPSSGFAKLAELIEAEYFDVVLTFNFDDLLERALSKTMSLRDVKAIIRGETDDRAMATLLGRPEPRFKLFKLHGSLRSSDYFLFDSREMLEYPEAVALLVKDLTRRDIIVCGYAMADLCVVSSFSKQGGSVYCVNPSGAPDNLRGFLQARASHDLTIECPFDDFFDRLHHALFDTAPVDPAGPPPINPFKFLESYEEGDREAFKGRDDEKDEALAHLTSDAPPQVLIVVGDEKVGKTSFAKAGLLAALDDKRYLKRYHRCDEEIEASLPNDLAKLKGMEDVPHDMSTALKQLGALAKQQSRRAVLVLDQFERVLRRYPKAERENRRRFLEELSAGCNDALTLVLVVVSEDAIPVFSEMREPSKETLNLERLEPEEIRQIIEELVAENGLSFESGIIEDIVGKYGESGAYQNPDRLFTLAHVQAVCHILGSKAHVDRATYDRIFQANETALNQAINAYDIIGFLEDFSWHEARQMRNIIKVALRESKERVAKFIKEHYTELLLSSDTLLPDAVER